MAIELIYMVCTSLHIHIFNSYYGRTLYTPKNCTNVRREIDLHTHPVHPMNQMICFGLIVSNSELHNSSAPAVCCGLKSSLTVL